MLPDTLDGGVDFPKAPSQFVGHEHDPPLRIEDCRPMTGLIQRRRVRGQGRIFGERQGLDRGHDPTLPTDPKTAIVHFDARCLLSRTRTYCPSLRSAPANTPR